MSSCSVDSRRRPEATHGHSRSPVSSEPDMSATSHAATARAGHVDLRNQHRPSPSPDMCGAASPHVGRYGGEQRKWRDAPTASKRLSGVAALRAPSSQAIDEAAHTSVQLCPGTLRCDQAGGAGGGGASMSTRSPPGRPATGADVAAVTSERLDAGATGQ